MKIINQSLDIAQSCFKQEYDSRSGYQTFHFAFIWKRSCLLSIGKNNLNNENPKALMFAEKFNVPDLVQWPYMHAEIDAVSKLWGKYHIDRSLKMVVIRLNRDFLLRNSKPCSKCQMILHPLGLTKRMWHSTNNGVISFI